MWPACRPRWGRAPSTNRVPQRSAVAVERLLDAGAIVLGKTNTPEFGHKGITDNLRFGPTSTPWAIGYNSGGSSGGSAAAVADGMATLAQGTDGGGSVRIPAAFSGTVGFKPSFGRIPSVTRPDAFLWGHPLVHIGPLTRTRRRRRAHDAGHGRAASAAIRSAFPTTASTMSAAPPSTSSAAYRLRPAARQLSRSMRGSPPSSRRRSRRCAAHGIEIDERRARLQGRPRRAGGALGPHDRRPLRRHRRALARRGHRPGRRSRRGADAAIPAPC